MESALEGCYGLLHELNAFVLDDSTNADYDSPHSSFTMFWSDVEHNDDVPGPLRSHAACVGIGSSVWVFGGSDWQKCHSSIWHFDCGAFILTETLDWTLVKHSGTPPSPRRAHSATFAGGYIFIFGGGDGSSYLNDIHVFDTRSYQWFQPTVRGPPPYPRRAHTCSYHDGRLHIFGGGSAKGPLNDLYILDIHDPYNVSWTPTECKGNIPPGRGYHTANIANDRLVVIGGGNGKHAFSDVYVLDIDTLTWHEVPLRDRYALLGHSSTHIGAALLVFGGHDNYGYNNQILFFDLVGLRWEIHPVAGKKPSGRGSHQAWF